MSSDNVTLGGNTGESGCLQLFCVKRPLQVRQMFDGHRRWLQTRYHFIHSSPSRLAEDMESYCDSCVAVTPESLKAAVEWLWKLDREVPVSNTAACEAVIKAMNDPQVRTLFWSDLILLANHHSRP